MWPLPKVQHERICVSINNSHATCAWISPSKKNKPLLKAYKIIAWEHCSRTLSLELKDFVKEHNLNNSLLSIALSAPLIHEQLIRLSTASPSLQHLNNALLKKMLWDYRYVHTLDDGQSLFYVCAIDRPHIFSHQLLAHQTGLHLINITSGYMALIQAYRSLFGLAFRRSQLAVDLIAHNYQPEAIIGVENIMRLLQISPTLNVDLAEQKIPLLTMIGLFNQERIMP